MPTVSKFVLNDTSIDVEDSTARSLAQSASTDVSTLNTRVTAIEELSRLTVEYTENNKTITFKNATH